jgi:hypothetical protein
MYSRIRVRTIASLAAVGLAAVLAACADPKPPPPPPAPPPVSLSPRLIEQASAYRRYVSESSAIQPAFVDGAAVASALQVGVAYEPRALQRGAIAYGAIVALQDPAFLAGVRAYANDAPTRQVIIDGILKDPAYVVAIAGSGSAAGLVTAAIGGEGRGLFDQGKRIKQAAYDVQRQPWSKAEVLNRSGRLALAKSLSSTPSAGDAMETLRLQQAVAGATPLGVTGAPISPPYTPVVIRSLAVAALAILNAANDAQLEQVFGVMGEPMSANCLNLAKLNLYQCLAVSKPHYEDVFCLGQHIMMDTGQCLSRAAGLPDQIDVKTAPLTVAETTDPLVAAVRKTPPPKR